MCDCTCSCKGATGERGATGPQGPMGPPYSPTYGIYSAHAGGLQPLATILTTEYNAIDTVVSSGDSCKFPSATVGMRKVVTNYTATSMDLYPATGENFYGLGANVSLSIGAGMSVTFFCYTAGVWR